MPSQRADQAAITAAYLAQQRALSSSLARDLVVLVRGIFNSSQLGRSWSATKVALDSLIRERHRQSAGLAARYYVDLRAVAMSTRQRQPPSPEQRPSGRSSSAPVPGGDGADRVPSERAIPRPPAAVTPSVDEAMTEDEAWAELERIAPVKPQDLDGGRVESNLNATGIGGYRKAIRAGQPSGRALDTMAVNLTGAATTLALEGGRDVIRRAVLDDDDAIGWARVTDADPCAWCAMLASRGAVYRTAQTAGGRRNKEFVGEGMFKFHNHDQCTAVPVFDPSDPVLDAAETLYDQWLEHTAGESGKGAIKAWTAFWNTRTGESTGETPQT